MKPLGFDPISIERLLEIGTEQCQQAVLDCEALDAQSTIGTLDRLVQEILDRERGTDGGSDDASGSP
jgi:hypothetical protein